MKSEIIPIPANVEITGTDIVDAAVKVHKAMGPGLLESVYEECMCYELSTNRGLKIARQVDVPISYDGHILQNKLRLDILVEECVIIELKAVEQMSSLFEAQLITYLKLANLRLGFLINFNVPLLKHGIQRIVV